MYTTLCRVCQISLVATISSSYADGIRKHYDYKDTVLHNTPYSLYESVIAGCFICRSIWVSELKVRNELVSDDHLQQARNGDVPGTYEDFCNYYGPSLNNKKSPYISFSFGRTEDDIFFYLTTMSQLLIPEGVRKPAGASTAASVDLWKHWLSTCLKSHEKCCIQDQQHQAFVPKRLIEISNNGSHLEWQLVHGADVGIVPYLTLSHCWGTSKHLELISDNYSELKEASSDSRLPKTYRDAFRIATSLGFRFIWIDSLCIIQGDEKDWKDQSSDMGLIYSSALCNIAAAWGKDGTAGCFSQRDPSCINGNIVSLIIDGRARDYKIQVVPKLSYDEDIASAPLNRRAWVIQERYLARRQLSFSMRQVYWECSEPSASEQFPDGMPRHLFEVPGRSAPPAAKPSIKVSAQDFPETWRALVDLYSNCDATRKSDKMIALAGLAGELRKHTATTYEYLAGLWKENMLEQLCWRNDGRRINRLRISPYIAPTWSWASLDSSVVSAEFSSDDRLFGYNALGQVIEAYVDSSDNAKLHSFTGSKLVLKGIALRAHATRESRKSGNRYELVGHDEGFISVEIYWDENMSDTDASTDGGRWAALQEDRAQELLFMYLDTRFWAVRGLVLKMLPGSGTPSSYVRVGTFEERGDGIFDHIMKWLGCRYNEGSKSREFSQIWEQSKKLNDERLANLVHTVTVI